MIHVRRALLGAALAAALPAVAAAQNIGLYAGTPVNFYTTGIFSQSGMNVGSFGGLTLTFTGVGNAGTPATVDPSPFTFTSFGEIRAATSLSTLNPVSGNFTLNIFQSAPTAGNSSLAGTLSGNIDVNTSTATLTVNPGTVNIGGVLYNFAQTVYALVPPTTNNGITSLQGRVEVTAQSTVPEPSTYALMATGLGGVMAAGFRRRRTAA